MKSFCRSTAFEELLGVHFGMVSCFIIEKNAIIERTTTMGAAFPLLMPLLPPHDSGRWEGIHGITSQGRALPRESTAGPKEPPGDNNTAGDGQLIVQERSSRLQPNCGGECARENKKTAHCGEGQTERRACALFTEREVSFRVEASARTMTKESL